MDVPETNQSTPHGTPQETPQDTAMSKTDEAFVADRQIFWGRFTNFAMGATGVVVLVVIGLYVFFG